MRGAEADPDLAHGAIEEVCELAGQKVINAISVRINELRAELKASMDTRFAEL